MTSSADSEPVQSIPSWQYSSQRCIFTDRRRRKPLTSSHGDEGGVPFWSGVAGHRSDRSTQDTPRRPAGSPLHCDPFVLFVMILMVLFGENDDMGTQVGGSGKLLDRLSQLGQQVNTMMNQFQAGSFTGTSAKTFFDEMSSFANLFRDQRLASAFPQVMMVYNNFFSTNTSTGNPIVTTVAETIGGTTYPVGTPIGAIYAACQKEAAANPNDKNPYAALADAMNNFYPNPSNPTSVTPGYQTINQDISQLNSSVTSVSNLTTQQAQTVTSLIEKLQAMLSASLSEITDVNKFIVQAIQSSKG